MTTRPLLAVLAILTLAAASGCSSCGGCGPVGGCGGDCPYGMQPPLPCAGGCCTWLDFLGAGPHLRQILEPAPRVASPCGHGPSPWWAHVETAGYERLGATDYEPLAPEEYDQNEPGESVPLQPAPEFSPPQPEKSD